MGTIAKALRKRQAELAKAASEQPPLDTPGPQTPAKADATVKDDAIAPATPALSKTVVPAHEAEAQAAQRAERVAPAAAAPKPAAGPAARFGRSGATPSGAAVSAAPAPPEGIAAPGAGQAEPSAAAAADTDGSGVDCSLVSILDPDGPEADLFRMLRTRILFPQSGRPPRTILVTSALAEEGKSFVAANLAVNIAKNVDEHVLLVDADLRKPSICGRFGFNGVRGLSEYLSAGVPLPDLLLRTRVQKLTLLASGAPPANPSELISSGRMSALVGELRERYKDRYILIDSPPPMVAPETAALAQWVDGILVVARYGSTPLGLVEDLIAQLDREKIIGAVINRIPSRDFQRYAYKKYYGKYRSYQRREKNGK
jgi:capsular exopolysaccharide synthesis family protein